MSFRTPHLNLAQAHWALHLKPGDHVVDATAGNGHDTCVLARLLQGQGRLIAYDIQPLALENTQKLLESTLTLKERSIIEFKLTCHASLEERNLALIVYNLGYLPGGDKTLTTCTPSTLLSLKIACDALQIQGALSLTCYPGHEEGLQERDAILAWARTLSPYLWEVRYHTWPNKGEKSPEWLWIQRLS